MKVIFKLFVLLSVFGLHLNVFAEEIDREYQGVSKNPDLQAARTEILENAQLETIGALISQMIGKEKYIQNQKYIQEKVFADTSKYLISYRTSAMNNLNGVMKMTVQMKIDLDALKSSLVRHKLLAQVKAGNLKQYRLVIAGTSGLVLFDQLRSEIQNQVPELSQFRERAITRSTIEFLVEMTATARLAPGRYLQIQGKRCELQQSSHDKIDCVLN